jgi:hypothetical protein
MVVGVVGIGILSGLLSALVMLLAGWTLAIALSTYAFVGLVLTATTAAFRVHLENVREQRSI